jgi:hypothetical protein
VRQRKFTTQLSIKWSIKAMLPDDLKAQIYKYISQPSLFALNVTCELKKKFYKIEPEKTVPIINERRPSGTNPIKLFRVIICQNKLVRLTLLNISTLARGLYYKTFYGRNLRTFIISWSVCPWQAFAA